MTVQIDSLDAIKKLGELKALGLVTEEEFQEKKALIRLKEKQEILVAKQALATSPPEPKKARTRHRSKKRREGEDKAATIEPVASSHNSHKLKKRRKIETLEGTTTPASNPDRRHKKNGSSAALFVGLGILVVVCLGAVFWLLLR